MFLLVGSCCTKKGCLNVIDKNIYIKYVGYESDELDQVRIELFKDNSSYGNAYSTYFYNNTVVISPNMIPSNEELSSFNYVIHSKSRIDTISNISYIIKQTKIKCNKCLPFGYQYEDAKELTDYKYEFNSVTHYGNDTLKVLK